MWINFLSYSLLFFPLFSLKKIHHVYFSLIFYDTNSQYFLECLIIIFIALAYYFIYKLDCRFKILSLFLVFWGLSLGISILYRPSLLQPSKFYDREFQLIRISSAIYICILAAFACMPRPSSNTQFSLVSFLTICIHY